MIRTRTLQNLILSVYPLKQMLSMIRDCQLQISYETLKASSINHQSIN